MTGMASFADLVTKELSDDLVWREQELAFMRKQLIVAPVGSIQEKTLLRANLAMIYAHYEGFCKFALELYIDALERLKLKRKELVWPLAAFSMGKLHKVLCAETERVAFFSAFINEFEKQLEEVAEYDRLPQIANLWPDLLHDWLSRLDLSSEYVTNGHATLEALVYNRNQIAHGKKLMVASRAELDKFSEAATLAMHEVAVGISEALEKRTYRRHSFVNTILGHAVR